MIPVIRSLRLHVATVKKHGPGFVADLLFFILLAAVALLFWVGTR